LREGNVAIVRFEIDDDTDGEAREERLRRQRHVSALMREFLQAFDIGF